MRLSELRPYVECIEMSNEELLNEYETAIAIYITRPKGEEGNSEERLLELREEILRRMK